MWSYDRTVQIEKPLVAVPWRLIGFYALTGKSEITYKERLVKETIAEALEEIREVGFCSWPTTMALITQNSLNNGPTNSASSSSHPAVLIDIERNRTAVERRQTRDFTDHLRGQRSLPPVPYQDVSPAESPTEFCW